MTIPESRGCDDQISMRQHGERRGYQPCRPHQVRYSQHGNQASRINYENHHVRLNHGLNLVLLTRCRVQPVGMQAYIALDQSRSLTR